MPNTSETALEKTFSDLAYSHLRDQSQSLLDYLVGFQLLKSEDDGERAVGIFGFEVDNDYYYAPIFFLNGEIRGLDTLYSVKSDLFMPITEGWVNHVINRRQANLGDSDRRDRRARGINYPNYTRLKIIPGGSGSVNLKLASEQREAMITAMTSEREIPRLNLIQGLKEAGATEFFKEAMERHPRMLEAFNQFYNVFDLEPQRKQAAEEKDLPEPVTIITSMTDEGVDQLTDEQRETLLEGGEVAIDNRPEVSRSILYKKEIKQVLENPTKGGLYDVLWYDGSVYPALIAPTGSSKNEVTVYCPEFDMHCEIDSRCVFIARRYGDEELRRWLEDNAVPASEARPGQSGIFVSTEGEGTGAFCIEGATQGVDGLTIYIVHDTYEMRALDGHSGLNVIGGASRGNNGNPTPNMYKELSFGGSGMHHMIPGFSNRPAEDPNCRVSSIIVAPEGGSNPRYSKDKCIVNDKHFYFLKLNNFTLRKPEYDDLNTARREEEKYNAPKYDVVLSKTDFGNYDTLAEGLDKVAGDLKSWNDGDQIVIDSEIGRYSMNKTAAFRHLMVDQGLGEDDAKLVLKEASRQPSTYKIKKVAASETQLLQLPDVDDTDVGGLLSSFHRTQVPYATANQAQTIDNREFYRYYSPYGSGGAPDNETDTFSVLEEAGKTGQKDVFDAAALASLIKNHNPTDLVDRFLPTIVSGMDRIGRMLFLIYWHYEDFEERYGENDLSELIDNLRSVFEQLGDVIISAKKRTLSGDPEHYGMEAAPLLEGGMS